MTCRNCSKPLPERSGRGRPPSYCSVGCRRAAEFEIRRLQAAIERTEHKIRWHREHLALAPEKTGIALACCGGPTAQQKHLDVLLGQVAELEERFAHLLDDDPES